MNYQFINLTDLEISYDLKTMIKPIEIYIYRHYYSYFELNKDILDRNESQDPEFKTSSLHNGIYLLSHSIFIELSSKYNDNINFINIGDYAFIYLQNDIDFKRNKIKWVLYFNIEGILNNFNSINNLSAVLIYYILYSEILASINYDEFNLNKNKKVKEFLIYEKFKTILPEVLDYLDEIIVEYDELEQYYPRFIGRNSLTSEINSLKGNLNKYERNTKKPILIIKSSFFESDVKNRKYFASTSEFSDEFISDLSKQLDDFEELENSIKKNNLGAKDENIS